MILTGTRPTPPAVSAFALDRMPFARGLHNMSNRVEPVLEDRYWEAAASTCISCVAAWHGGEAAVQATMDMASQKGIDMTTEQTAWIHYELELLSAWMAAAQSSVNIQVTPGAMSRIAGQTILATPMPLFPSYPTCIRMDGSRPRTLPNGMPVDMVYVEYLERRNMVRLMLVTPLGNGLSPFTEGAAFMIDLDDLNLGMSLQEALRNSVDRKVEEMHASSLIAFDPDALVEHLEDQIPVALSLLPTVFCALREADGMEHEADRDAPDSIRRLDSGRRASLDWGDVIYL
jgi:hypothetical protein